MAALDYAKVARLYDEYCTFALDIPFFVDLAARARGSILELMAGTGRVSLPLVERGARLTCVDGSLDMLAVLRTKLRRASLAATIACVDVRDLAVAPRFEHVILPFHGFSEITGEADQRRTLAAVARALAPGGRFVCTLHDPEVRLRTVDGTWHSFPEIARADGGTLRLWVRATWSPDARLVVGLQRIEVRRTGSEAPDEDVVVELRFVLPSLADLTALAAPCGLSLEAVFGDYEGHSYEPGSSPYIVAVFVKT